MRFLLDSRRAGDGTGEAVERLFTRALAWQDRKSVDPVFRHPERPLRSLPVLCLCFVSGCDRTRHTWRSCRRPVRRRVTQVLPSESPFPCHWWGISLEDAGLGEVRPDVGTYGRYEFDCMPPVPYEMRGDFAWLASAPDHGATRSGSSKPPWRIRDRHEAIASGSGARSARIRSLPPSPVPVPWVQVGPGRYVRGEPPSGPRRTAEPPVGGGTEAATPEVGQPLETVPEAGSRVPEARGTRPAMRTARWESRRERPTATDLGLDGAWTAIPVRVADRSDAPPSGSSTCRTDRTSSSSGLFLAPAQGRRARPRSRIPQDFPPADEYPGDARRGRDVLARSLIAPGPRRTSARPPGSESVNDPRDGSEPR